jgi:hypothetical protein
METLAIERSVLIAASPQAVWSANTEPKHLEQWYAPGCPWEIPALQPGATIKFHNTDTDIQLATIEVLEPLREFETLSGTLKYSKRDMIHPESPLARRPPEEKLIIHCKFTVYN